MLLVRLRLSETCLGCLSKDRVVEIKLWDYQNGTGDRSQHLLDTKCIPNTLPSTCFLRFHPHKTAPLGGGARQRGQEVGSVIFLIFRVRKWRQQEVGNVPRSQTGSSKARTMDRLGYGVL